MSLERFSVATFNLYNLQLPGSTMNPGQKLWTQAEFDRKVGWIGGQLGRSTPTSSACRSCGTPTRWPRSSTAPGWTRRTTCSPSRPTAAGSSAARWCARGCCAGDPEWIGDFPDAIRLESSDPTDPQAPGDQRVIPGFSRPVLQLPGGAARRRRR